MNILIEDKLNIFHYKIARVLDKWREMGTALFLHGSVDSNQRNAKIFSVAFVRKFEHRAVFVENECRCY